MGYKDGPWTNLDGVFILSGEGINGSLLDALLALGQALVSDDRSVTGIFGLKITSQAWGTG